MRSALHFVCGLLNGSRFNLSRGRLDRLLRLFVLSREALVKRGDVLLDFLDLRRSVPIAHIEADIEHLGNIAHQKEQILQAVVDGDHVGVEDGEGVLDGLFRLFDLKFGEC